DAFGEALLELGARDERVVCLDADLASSSKMILFAEAYPQRFFQMGIAEANMTGAAAGLAAMGFVPFTNSFAVFATLRAADQIRVSIAQPGLPVKIAGAYSGLLAGKTGKTHQAIEDIALMRSMPNMTVVAPGDGVEMSKAVHAVAAWEGPVYLRATRDPSPVVFAESDPFEIGRAVLVREGTDVTVLTTGIMVGRAVEAAELLAAEGVSVHLVHVHTVKPLDVGAIVAAAEKTGLVVTAEEHNIIGGFGGAVAEALGEHRPTPMKRVGVADVYSESAPNDDLLQKYGLTAGHIAEAARSLLERRAALPSPKH
ncbi:MAG TPA: transketolase C-terminal domain-containing protein, partial [Thermoleophilia bacterium]|nr:transketolase C-terminal domain-containing protein [Thermoleophilia bacterium]